VVERRVCTRWDGIPPGDLGGNRESNRWTDPYAKALQLSPHLHYAGTVTGTRQIGVALQPKLMTGSPDFSLQQFWRQMETHLRRNAPGARRTVKRNKGAHYGAP